MTANKKPKDLYRVLGVKKTATDAEIKKAFRKKSMEHHPDRNPGDEKAAERFDAVQFAYQVLSDPDRKKLYDTTGEAGEFKPVHDPDVMDKLIELMTETFSGLMDDNIDIAKADVMNRLKSDVKRVRQEFTDKREGVAEGLCEMRKAAGRFIDKDGNKDNLLNDIVRTKITRQEQGIKELSEDIAVLDKVLDMLAGFAYQYDQDNTGMYYRPGDIINRTYKVLKGFHFKGE